MRLADSDLLLCTIKFCSVVFCVTFRLLVTNTSVGRYWQFKFTYVSNFSLLLTLWRHLWRHRKSPLLSLPPLEGLGLELGLQLRLGLHASSPKPNVSACVTRPFHDVIMLTSSSLTKLRVIIVYFYLPRQLTSYLFLPRFVTFCWISLRHTYFYETTSSCLA